MVMMLNESYVDMFKEGIIDPVKVVRTALQDAAYFRIVSNY